MTRVWFIVWLAPRMCCHFLSHQFSKLSEEKVPGPLSTKRLGNLQNCLVLQLVGGRSHLKSIRVNPLFPEPIRRPELKIARVNRLDSREGIAEGPPTAAILDAESDVADSVPHQTNIIARDRLQLANCLINDVP